MTVSELIEELKRHPQHHVVVMQIDSDDYEGNPFVDLVAVEEVGTEDGFYNAGPVVTLRSGND